MKKFYLYSLLTSLLLLCSTVASAHNFEVDGIFYNITSSTQKTVAVTYSGSSYYAVADEYSGIVTIPSTVTYNDVTYNVTSIEDNAFDGCTGVIVVKISEGIKIIGDYAFCDCSSLVTVTIPNSVTSIGGCAFYDCSSLAKLNIPNSVTSIGESAFRGCTGLTSITIGTSVTSIGYKVFYECSNLAKLNIPNGVTSIESDAFYRCTGLTSIEIPNSVTSIGGGAFYGCTGLTAVHITDLSAWYKIDFNDDRANPLCHAENLYLNGEKVTNLVVPSDITEIKNYAFYGCTSLTSVTIPNSVTSIGDDAFYRCTGLTSIEIPNSVTSIGGGAFSGCSGLTSITIPNSVTSIGGSAFSGCTGLTSIEIPNSVTSIGANAFSNCTGLTAVHITDLSAWCKINFATFASANPLYDGANLYLNGEKVTNLVVPSDITEIKSYAFSGCSGLTDITFHDNVMLINQSAFSGCSGLTNVTIGSGVMVLGANAFADCSNLRCVTIPNSVISIGGKAFYGCSNLYTVIDYSDLGITKGSTDNGYVGYYAKKIYTSGDDIPQDYIFETIDGVNTLVAYFGKSNDVVLPSNYNGGNYAIGDRVFYNSSITSIKIPNGVTSIGNYAFGYCSGLTSIEIPNSVTSIGDYAFRGCAGLTSIEIPNSVTSIGYSAFYECSSLAKLNIPNSVTSIGNYAFYRCPSLEKVEINTTTVGSWFKGCTSIKEIIIGDSVTSIGDDAFYGCTGLTSIEIPNSVTSIGDNAFEGCTGLTSIIIPNSVTSIRGRAFYGCTGLTSIIIPNSVTSIGGRAFGYCSGLTSIEIPNSVTTIGDWAFSQCTGLTEIYVKATTPPTIASNSTFDNCYSATLYVPAGSKAAYQAANYWNRFTNIIEEIPGGICGDDATWILRDSTLTISGSGAMYNYTDSVAPWSTYRLEIKEVVVNDSVTSIGNRAFYECSGLASVTIGSGVTSIGESAFYYCTGLTSVTIPNSVTTIGYSAFYGCTGLTSIEIPNGVTSIGNWAFGYCSGLTSIEIPNSVTSIGRYAFYKCTGLTSITIPNSVTSIGDYAFNGCTGLTSIEIPNSVTSIGNSAFNGCTGITSITIPNSVTSIGDDAFYGCTGLTSVTIPNSVTSIGYSAFYGCTGLTSVTIPNSVTSIGESAFNGCPLEKVEINTTTVGSWFKGCTSIKEIIIGDSVTTIGDYAFYKCTGLTSVTIGNSVTTIGDYAFYECTGLTSVAIPNSVTSIGNYAFQYSDLREIHIPASVTSIGDYAFTWNLNLQGITMDSGNKVYNIPANSNVVMRGDSVVFGWQGAVIPENAVAIGNGAFNSVSGITSITIPASVTSIGEWAFEACSDLTEIYCLSETPARIYSTTFQGLYDTVTLYVPAIGKNEYAGVSYWKKFTNIVLVGEIVVDGLSYAVISEEEKTVQVIGYSGSNEFVKIPSSITKNGNTYSVTSIGGRAFYGCTGLTGIEIPNSVTTMGDYAFYGCTSLTSVTIPNSVTSMGDYAFYNCTGLTSVTIPNSLTTIGEDVFYGCTGLTAVHITDLSAWCKISFEYNSSNPLFYAKNLYLNGEKVTNLVIPSDITEIKGRAFRGCSGLTSIRIGSSVTSIGDYAFRGCSGLTSITIGSSVTSIGDYAFYDCTSLKTVANNSSLNIVKGSTTNGYVAYYADKVINVPDGSFEGDYIFTIIDGVNTLYAYIGNDSIISLPANYKGGSYMIGDNAFNGNTVITGVTIPESVTAIGADAFQGCSALKDIYVNGIVPALLYSESFAEHYASATLHVPAGTKAAYQSSVSQREEMEIRRLPVYNNDLLASMSGCDKDAIYETVKVEVQNPDVAGTLNGNDYLLAYQPVKNKLTDLPKATFETSIVHGGRYKIALVTVPWFIESYKDTLISKITDPLYADSYLRVRVNQNNEQLAMFPCDSFNIGTSKTNFGVWEKHAIVPDRSRIDTIFLKDANNEDYIFDFVNGHSVGVNIELLRPLQYNERNGRYTAKNANNFAFRFLLDQIMLIPVDESTIVSTIYWKNFNNIVEEANDLTGDIDGDGTVDVADATTLVSMILDNSLATDAADVDGDGTVDVADVTSLVSIILGTRTANDAPAKAAATRAGEISTVSADGDGETLLINIDNPGYPFSAIQFDLELPEGIEVDFDGEYYAVDLGSRTNSRKHSYPECAIQPDGSLRVVIISMSNALYNGTEGDVATATLKVNGADDGDYRFTIKNVVLSAPGSKEKLEPYTGWINVTGGVTGISEIKEERAESNDIYDLQGRKVTEPVKGGIYIQNGKKVMW